MKAVLFWHGQFIGASYNSFKYWRGWVSEVDDAWHFYYQFGRMAGNGGNGSSRVGCNRMSGKTLALRTLRDKAGSKACKGYTGKWYYYTDSLALWDFPLGVPGQDWELSMSPVGVVVAKAKATKPVRIAVQPDDVPNERRSPLSIGWRLDL